MSVEGVINGDGEIAGAAAAYETNSNGGKQPQQPDAIAIAATMITNRDNFDKSAAVHDRNENNDDN